MAVVVRVARQPVAPWANGGGTTVELLRLPAGEEWSLRWSIATLDGPALFSVLPGVDRVLVPFEPVTLVVDGDRHPVAAHTPFAFAGTSAVHAVDVRTPVSVLNVMGRDLAPAVRTTAAAERVEGVVVALTAGVLVDGVGLARGDAVWCDQEVDVDVDVGGGAVAVTPVR